MTMYTLTPSSPSNDENMNPFYLSLRRKDDEKLALIEQQYEPSSPADGSTYNFDLLRTVRIDFHFFTIF